ncbi:MAG: competence/damage-inducible protein A [Acidobacteriota bacterium]
MNAEIITVGTELLLFAHGNLNADYINEKLGKLGIKVLFRTRVGDELEHIENAIRSAAARVDLVIITGGLSLSRNDLTRDALARAVALSLKLDQKLLDRIKKKLESRGMAFPKGGERMAMLPDGAEPLENKAGIVPGIFLKFKKVIIVCMPGALREIESIITSSFLARIKTYLKGVKFLRKIYKIYGLAELEVESRARDLYDREACSFSTLSSLGQVELDLIIEGESQPQIEKIGKEIDSEIRKRLGVDIFGEDGDTLESVTGRILAERKMTLAVAESCTGGLLAEKITEIPGSSRYFKGGVVSYSDDAKEKFLGIPGKDIRDFGAISQEVARSMAENVREKAQSDLAISITGIAGPEGGTIDKPVGLIFIGIADKNGIQVEQRTFLGDRQIIRKLAVQTALDLLRRRLLTIEPSK